MGRFWFPSSRLGTPLQAKLLLCERSIYVLRHVPQAGAWEREKVVLARQAVRTGWKACATGRTFWKGVGSMIPNGLKKRPSLKIMLVAFGALGLLIPQAALATTQFSEILYLNGQ